MDKVQREKHNTIRIDLFVIVIINLRPFDIRKIRNSKNSCFGNLVFELLASTDSYSANLHRILISPLKFVTNTNFMSTWEDPQLQSSEASTSRHPLSTLHSPGVCASSAQGAMECRLCLCSAPAGSFVSIHDDSHPPGLAQRILTCCRLRVRKGDHLPDMICLSCVNNLELLDSFRNACFQSDTTSRVGLDKYLKVEPEEVLVEDLIWENELGAGFPTNISSSPDDGSTPGGKISWIDNMAEIIDTDRHILAEEIPLRKALDKTCSTHSELDPKIDFQDNSFTNKHNLATQRNSFSSKPQRSAQMRLHNGAPKPLNRLLSNFQDLLYGCPGRLLWKKKVSLQRNNFKCVRCLRFSGTKMRTGNACVIMALQRMPGFS
ncbi:uncharacterized protein LOC143913699 [Arctopsyche grandis]|uniref:uncharacterized protein LOC143913699 n=1 Tax=Arctopsyche grandis TaxID=121162 RepID=UPI00406DA40A